MMMVSSDFINSLFEFSGMFFIMPSIFKLHKQKRIQGISFIHVLFFLVWGMWNLYYYQDLNQPLSLIGAVGILTVNAVWVSQIFYYRNN